MPITALTYNIHACIGTDGRFDPDRIVAVLKETRADVIALQEVEHHDVDGLDLLDYLAEKTGLTPIAGPTLMRETRDYGNAVLTRLPIFSIDRIDLSQTGREPRGAVDVRLDCEGCELRVIATHLGLRPWERHHQVEQLLKLLESANSDLSVLMGDINEWFLWGRVLRRLHAHFKSPPERATFPSRLPFFALDRIWVEPNSRLVSLKTHNTTLSRCASDHLPLKAVIEACY